MGHFIFVYGTLRHNERNHGLLKDSTLISQQAWTAGRLIDTGHDYPALLLDSDELVYGEIYEVDDGVLAKVDELEGYTGHPENDHYQRTERVVFSDFGEFNALLYYYPKEVENAPEVPYGDWRLKTLLDKKETPLYFAYGSCMDHERIDQAGMLDQFRTVGMGLLKNHEVRFTVRSHDGGRADIVEAHEHEVEGIVYEISEQAMDYLYEREGVYIGKYRPAVIDVEIQDQIKPMLTFIVKEKLDEIAPPDHYLNEIIRGGTPHLTESYLRKIEQRVNSLRVGE
ncbi:gamma-glutamylcyclotransferase family protein [Piscibacillus halophilus]|uniref:Gamma-glutamylcyclotransferase family protein n=1 Tax=Piscibacillus halophilus TaxID=571933 RepID=A0A1H9H1E9_9BACI|nr:gamma-glutamylcyclotransferase family protein [Piscibacillus halophilus]SEQ56172.1 Uncharacterized conserved protein YtfP, gamma-glutamylcyclotransferase (GGCT)/AIG2-like family [Piscibacillus halophilus]